jgi:hypothetical protein
MIYMLKLTNTPYGNRQSTKFNRTIQSFWEDLVWVVSVEVEVEVEGYQMDWSLGLVECL